MNSFDREYEYMKRIVFLDFDGVVNTPIWMNYVDRDTKTAEFQCRYAWPHDGYVNNHQAVCWLNELYNKFPFDIVITSSWRQHEEDFTAEHCLRSGGLSNKIKVLGSVDFGPNRPNLIKRWMRVNDFHGDFIILDDEDFFSGVNYPYSSHPTLNKFFVKTDENLGFTIYDFEKACDLFNQQENRRMISLNDSEEIDDEEGAS